MVRTTRPIEFFEHEAIMKAFRTHGSHIAEFGVEGKITDLGYCVYDVAEITPDIMRTTTKGVTMKDLKARYDKFEEEHPYAAGYLTALAGAALYIVIETKVTHRMGYRTVKPAGFDADGVMFFKELFGPELKAHVTPAQ